MKKILIRILVCTLLITTAASPVVAIVNNNDNIIENRGSVKSEPQYRTTSQDDVDWWSMFHHDLNNTGYSTSQYAPRTNNILWTYETGFLVSSSPAIVNNKVYIGSDDEFFYCLNADTGDLLWKNLIPGGTSISSPCVVDEKVYMAAGYDHVFCWDADTGDEIWKFYKGYGIPYSPAVSDGKVYMPMSIDNNKPKIYCLDAGTGKEIWNKTFGEGEINHVALYEGKVYVPYHYCQNGRLYCLDGETGEIIWEKYTAGRRGAPAIANGKVYASADGISCLDPDTGEEFWHYQGGWSFCSPAVAYDKVYYVSNAGEVLCLDADTGEEIWVYIIGSDYEHAFPSPAVADGKIYVGIWSNGKLLCLDAYSGDFIWDYQVSVPNWLFSSPAIADGRLYIGGGGPYKIYCFGYTPHPPEPPTISGATIGLEGVEYDFTVFTTEPEDEDVYYWIDWGDDTSSGWIGPYISGEEIIVSHAWDDPGTYKIRAKAMDVYYDESKWSDALILNIESLIDIQSIKGGLFKVNAEIKNNGVDTATDVQWSITLKGGVFIGKKTEGSGLDIPAGVSETITSNLIIGFGPFIIAVDATTSVGFSDTRVQKGFAFLFFTKVYPSG